jgi:hypothetical protein
MQRTGHAPWHTIAAQPVALDLRTGTYAMTAETLACKDCSTTLKGGLAFADTTTGTHHGVLLMQEAFALGDGTKVRCRMLAEPVQQVRRPGRHRLLARHGGVRDVGVRLIVTCAAP